MKLLHKISFILLVVGGLNWLLHAFDLNVVDMIFGAGATLSKIIYVLVGLSALFEIFTHKSNCNNCTSGSTAKV